jgi:adenosine deaminase
LREDGDLLHYINDHRIPLEVCPSSNVQTGAVRDLFSHPIKLYQSLGLPFHIKQAYLRRVTEALARLAADGSIRPAASPSTSPIRIPGDVPEEQPTSDPLPSGKAGPGSPARAGKAAN